jgi:hypothetical protein
VQPSRTPAAFLSKRILGTALLLMIFAAVASPAAAQTSPPMRLVPTRLYEGITAKIPAAFTPMNEALFALKYGNRSRRSTVAYADANAEANIVFELKPRPEDPDRLKERIRRSLEKDPAIRRVSAEQTVISGKPAVIFEFESQAMDTPVYNILFFVSAGLDRTLTGNFNCPVAMMPQWQAAGRDMVRSISVD